MNKTSPVIFPRINVNNDITVRILTLTLGIQNDNINIQKGVTDRWLALLISFYKK